MPEFPVKEIGRWISEQYKSLNPDIVIPAGNRIFNLLFLLQKESKEFKEMFEKVFAINAIHYMDCNSKSFMVIDEETEYGRKFLFDIFPHFRDIFPNSVNCFTIFLRDDSKSKNKRKEYIRDWKKTNPEMREIANCLQSISSYDAYDNSQKFHSAIFNFRNFIRSNLRRPYNMDATLFSVSFDKKFSELKNKLSNYGYFIEYDEDTFILIPDFFDVKRYNTVKGIRIIDGTLPKLRFFRTDDGSLIVSPMCYFSIKFTHEKPVFDTELILRNHPLLYQMFKAWIESNRTGSNNKNYIIQLYDLLVFWLDIELFKNFIKVLERSGLDFNFEIEQYPCITHYGKTLGNKLLKIIRENVVASSQLSLDLYPKVKYDVDPYNIDCNVATLLSIRAACLKQYAKRSFKSFKREGLTFSGIQKELNLDALSTSICIDLLCDNTYLKPFDKAVDGLQIARFYNTDIEDFIGIFTKLLWRAQSEGIPIGKVNLGKFVTFLNYFAITINKKYKSPIKIIYAPVGKVVGVMTDESDEYTKRLEDILTNYYQYKDVFEYQRGQFKVKDKTLGTLEHLDIVESEAKLDSCLDIIFGMYKKLQNYLDEHPEIVDSKGYRRTIYDVFPGFIELLGPEYPEGGLKIVGVLTKRALYYYWMYLNNKTLKDGRDPKKEAERLLLHTIPHKIQMYQVFSGAYLECYKYLSDPYISTRRDVWKNMCVYPSDSVILKFCNRVVSYIQEKIKNVLNAQDKSLRDQRFQSLQSRVKKFLDLMTDFSSKPGSGESIIQKLPKGFSGNRYIVSVDLRNSTKIYELKDPRWESIISYFINIMLRWAKVYDGKLINFPEGDGVIIAFRNLSSARSFAAGCGAQLTEISESINQCETFGGYQTGCYVRITRGLVNMDENDNCVSEELSTMCKYLPKKEGKVVIDAKAISECIDFSGSEFVKEEGRSYCIVISKEEFNEMILSEFD